MGLLWKMKNGAMQTASFFELDLKLRAWGLVGIGVRFQRFELRVGVAAIFGDKKNKLGLFRPVWRR